MQHQVAKLIFLNLLLFCSLTANSSQSLSNATTKSWQNAISFYTWKPLEVNSPESGCRGFFVTGNAFSPDSQTFALGVHDFVERICGGGSSTLTLWNLATGEKIKTLINGGVAEAMLAEKPDREQEPDDPVALVGDIAHAVSFTPNSKILAASMSDKTIKLWDGKTGKLVRTLAGHRYAVHALAIAPDNQTLISGSSDQTIKLWNLQTGRLLSTFQSAQKVNDLLLNADRKILVIFTNADSIYSETTVNLWNLKTGKVIRTFAPSSGLALPVIFSPDGKTLISSSDDNTVKLWQAVTGTKIRSLSSHAGIVRSLAITSDGQFLASSSDDGSVKLWNMKTGQLIRTLSDVGYARVAFSPDGQTLVIDKDGELQFWNWRQPQKIRTIKNNNYLSFSPDGQTLLTVDREIYQIRVWR